MDSPHEGIKKTKNTEQKFLPWFQTIVYMIVMRSVGVFLAVHSSEMHKMNNSDNHIRHKMRERTGKHCYLFHISLLQPSSVVEKAQDERKNLQALLPFHIILLLPSSVVE